MKRIFFISILICTILLTGCSKYNEKDIVKDLSKKYKNVSSYQVEGNMNIYNGDNNYKYEVTSSYEKGKYRVSLINKSTNNEQIILRNDDGVYVLNPKLNKSFKFQSDWPNNSSQVYLIKSIIKDLNKDNKVTMQEINNGYILKCKVSYSNNKKLRNQKIYLTKKLDITKIEVFDKNSNIQIRMKYNNLDTNAAFNNKYFSVDENMKSSLDVTEKEDEETSLLDETVYPMYLPDGTYLSNEETVSKEEGERVILTFKGTSPFIIVEENAVRSKDTEVIPVYGEPTMLLDSVGAMSNNSVNFISSGVEYYIATENLSKEEILNVVESINNISSIK